MKKLIALLLLLVFAVSSAAAEEPFNLTGYYIGEVRNRGWIYVENCDEGVPITFVEEVNNVVIRHMSGMTFTLESVQAGDFVWVACTIPEGLPNLSVSYTLPGDEDLVVYTRMISKSGVDGSLIAMNDWYTEMAWKVAKRLVSIASDEGLLRAYSSSYEILDFIKNFEPMLSEDMPEKHYFVSTVLLEDVFEAALEQEEIQMKPENLELYLRNLPSTITSLARSMEGAVSLAASSILQTSECMILPDIPFEPGFIVFDSGEGRVIIVTVSLAGEGVVSFHASTVSRDTLETLTDMDALIEEIVG